MIYIALTELLIIAGALYVIFLIVQAAQSERKDLEDRLMALTQPLALTHVEGVRERIPGSVSYMDEEREVEREASVS